MKNKQVYIHIGYPKTGTSALQDTLAYNQEKLELAGFYYPNAVELWMLGSRGNKHSAEQGIHKIPTAHHRLVNKPNSFTRLSKSEMDLEFKPILTAFDKSSCHTLLISSESFTGVSLEYLRSLRDILSAYSCKIIL